MNQKIKETIYFNAPSHDVYEALMDEKKHTEFTGAKAEIEKKIGGKFSVWDGYATGVNKELIPNKLIAQTWRASDWSEDIVSKVKFELSEENGKTKLEFIQSGVPEDQIDEITNGWQNFYWKPLKEYLEK